MRYKVKDIGEEGREVEAPLTPAWLAEQCPDLEYTPGPGGLTVSGRLTPAGTDSFLLRGKLQGSLVLPCSRCLEPAELPIASDVLVTYLENEADEDDEEVADGGEVVTFDGQEIDVASDVRDELLLAIPISALCRPDCAGICPVCGGNRNAQPCQCEAQQKLAASKLSALKDLKV